MFLRFSSLSTTEATWDKPAVTTHRYRNHAVRDSSWRYIRYANGDEELYDEAADPYEWTNLARDPKFAARKAELAKALPAKDHPDIGGDEGAAAAGLKAGDKVISVDGKTVKSFDDLRDAIRADKNGTALAVRYERDGKGRTSRSERASAVRS